MLPDPVTAVMMTWTALGGSVSIVNALGTTSVVLWVTSMPMMNDGPTCADGVPVGRKKVANPGAVRARMVTRGAKQHA